MPACLLFLPGAQPVRAASPAQREGLDLPYGGNDDADLINVVSSIDESDIATIFVEQSEEHIKVSWRGLKKHVDVAAIAKQFGGGGHRSAAGAEVRGRLAEVQERVLRASRRALNHA